MKLMDELYYQFYLFYTKHIVDDEPYTMSAFVLGVQIAYILDGLFIWGYAWGFGKIFDGNLKFLADLLIIFIVVFFYRRKKRGKEIIKIKSENHRKGDKRCYVIMAFMLFAATIFMMNWVIDIAQWILEMR